MEINEAFSPDVQRSLARQKEEPSADKTFPDTCVLKLELRYDPQDMEKVKTWFKKTRHELGDKFVAEFDVPRLVYEALAGGAVNPAILSVAFGENPHA